MEQFELATLSRAIHVLGVILWIGGVAFVTTVIIPALKKMESAEDKLELFEQLEGRFAFQARIVTLITGLSGLYLIIYLDAWGRYLDPTYWWMHLMTLIWVLFTAILFVLEPLVLHRWFHKVATDDSTKAFLWLHRFHKIALTVSSIAVIGALSGAHGFMFF